MNLFLGWWWTVKVKTWCSNKVHIYLVVSNCYLCNYWWILRAILILINYVSKYSVVLTGLYGLKIIISDLEFIDRFYVYWTMHHCDRWRIKDQLDVTCYFISLLMFWTLIYPSSGACDYSVELPRWSYCSWFDVCWSFGVVGLEWYP